MIRLGVNVDHVATVRQARRASEPDPVTAAALAELGGADGITIHLREDRRHIQERDLHILRETVQTSVNLEMACAEEILEIAATIGPDQATLVPEKREELTTEGGLNVAGEFERVQAAVEALHEVGIRVSLFVDPDKEQLNATADTGADFIELHTGLFANAKSGQEVEDAYKNLTSAANMAHDLKIGVNAGHGLNYQNVQPICRLPFCHELNIGHSIVSRAVLVGMERAVREMKALMNSA